MNRRTLHRGPEPAKKAAAAKPAGKPSAVGHARRESEEAYRELVSRMPIGVLVYQDGRLVFANDYILGIARCPLNQLDSSLIELIHPDDRETVSRNMARRLAGKEVPSVYEIRAATRAGGWSTMVLHSGRITYKKKPATLYVLTDITEKKRSEKIQDAIYRISEAVHMSDNLPELFRSIHRTISGLMPADNFYIALFDASNGMLSFPYFVDEFDSPPQPKKPGRGLTEYVLRNGEPLLATPDILDDLERKGEIELIGAPSIDWLGVPLKSRDKTIGVLVVQTYSPGLRYGPDEKNILMFVSDQVAMAIERKRSESSLRRSEQRNRAVLSAMPDLMFLLDRDGIFLDYKAEKASDLLMKPEMFLGRRIADVLPSWLAQLIMENLERTFESRELQVYEYELELNGQPQNFEARSVLCGSDEVLVVVRNVTDKRRLEQQVLQSQKMESLGTLAGGIAHDFNNILAGILGYSSFLKSQMDSGHDFYKYLDTIERSASRAADLTSKLLSFTRGDRVNFRPLDLNRLVGETLEIIRHTVDRSIGIETRLDEALPTIEGDAGQIQQVVMNLCVNARDAMRGGGKLSIASSVCQVGGADVEVPAGGKHGAYVRLSVSDSGCGMGKEVLPRIFDPFFTTKAKGEGSGLGLSVVYGIVKSHEGFVTVRSQPGRGTVFHVFFPVSGRPETRENLLASPPSGRDELIFVVDDEEDIRSFIRDVLQSHGYRVLLAEDGARAVRLYEERWRQIDLVILDLVMPGIRGDEAFLKMKEVHAGVKALLSTGYSLEGRAGELIARGIKGFIQKPYDFTRLLTEIRQVLDMPD
jgi:two-component system cell cycle sensor histidine kinase/response regulator CckA